MTTRLCTVVGARPQFVKAAAVSRAIATYNKEAGPALAETLIHTGQHYDMNMSDVFFSDLPLPEPAYNLDVGSGSHAFQVAEMIRRLEPVIRTTRPDIVIVHGDTNSTLAGTLAAAQLQVPVAHVEAGLRSYRRDMAEEVNRVVADRLARILFCPSETARANLDREGIHEGVHVVGDVMLDLLVWQRKHLAIEPQSVLGAYSLTPGEYALVTVHRAGTADDPEVVVSIVNALGELARRGLPSLFPVHPRTRQHLPSEAACPGVRLVEPVPFREMLCLEEQAKVVLTDSGGVQKESYWLGVPCVTLRRETEWPETVEMGWNHLVGTDPEKIVEAAAAPRPSGPRPPVYGDGRAADRVVSRLVEWSA